MSTNDISDIILQELRELSSTVHTFNSSMSARIAVLEDQNKFVLGNGQPGRLSIIENQIKEIIKFKYWALGGAATIGALVGLVIKFL